MYLAVEKKKKKGKKKRKSFGSFGKVVSEETIF
jgi:hypothetical protein